MKYLFKYMFVCLGLMFASQTIAFAGNEDAVRLFKKSKKISEDRYQITLDTYVTGNARVVRSTKPVDAVLVLDVSSSMTAAKDDGKYLLSTMSPLMSGDPSNLKYLHDYDHDKQDTHNYKWMHDNKNNGKGTTASINNGKGSLRYVVKIKDKGTYNLAYFVQGRNYGTDDLNHTEERNKGTAWDKATGWYYDDDTDFTNSSKWTKYDGSADDIIYTDVKLDFLEKACRAFTDAIYLNATSDGGTAVDHKLAVVTWAGPYPYGNNLPDPVMTVDFQNVPTSHADLLSSVTHLETASGTVPQVGLDNAKAMLDELYSGYSDEQKNDRSKVILFFTDGEPNTFVGDILESGNPIKQGGTKLFTVGVFSDENGSAGAVNERDNCTISQYMSWLSSEYPSATGNSYTTYTPGDKNPDGVDYYKPSSGADLSEIFQEIAESIGAQTIALEAEDMAAIDVMSADFKLPDVAANANAQFSQWVCIGETDEPDGDVVDDATNEITAKYRGGYEFIPYTGTESKIYKGDSPSITVDNSAAQRVSVTGFAYGRDDETKTEGTTVTVTTYGNWVGSHADGRIKGKMLSFTFEVELKPESMGGYGLPTNEPTSGVYLAERNSDGTIKTDSEGNVIYSDDALAYYPLPVVDVPSIIIIKEGLKFGESAVFSVIKTKNEKGQAVDGGIHYNVMLSQENASGSMCYAVIKDLDPGYYKVTEGSWAWAYNADAAFGTEKELLLNEPNVPAIEGKTEEECIAAFKAAIKTAQGGDNWATYGTLTKQAAGNDLYYVDGFSDGNEALHLLYRFKNTPKDKKDDPVMHDEAYTLNVFGSGGGSAEHGGVDDEDPSME